MKSGSMPLIFVNFSQVFPDPVYDGTYTIDKNVMLKPVISYVSTG